MSMNKYRTLLDPSSVAEGDLIEFDTASTGARRKRAVTYGYVHLITYNTQKADTPTHYNVFEVIPAQEAQGLDRRYRIIDPHSAGDGTGLDPNKQWAVILDPIKVAIDNRRLGRRDGLVQRIGNIADTAEQSRLLEQIERIGGDEALYYGRHEDGPSMARPDSRSWGTYAPVGIKRDRFAESEYVQPEKPLRRKKPVDVKLHDIDLKDVPEILGLPKDAVRWFEHPEDRRVKAVTSLRQLWEIAVKDPAALEKYIPSSAGVDKKVPLADAPGIHIGVVNLLTQPKDPARTAAVTDLKTAYDLVTKTPEKLADFRHMGKAMQEHARRDIPTAYQNIFGKAGTEVIKPTDLAASVKYAWGSFTSTYLESLRSGRTPPEYTGADKTPVWKVVIK